MDQVVEFDLDCLCAAGGLLEPYLLIFAAASRRVPVQAARNLPTDLYDFFQRFSRCATRYLSSPWMTSSVCLLQPFELFECVLVS